MNCLVGSMRRWVLCILLIATSAKASDSIITGLSNDSHISGPKLKPEDLKGKVVLVEFWGRNCPPCRESLPHMQRLYSQYSKKGNFMLIGSHSQGRDDNVVLGLLKNAMVTYPVYQFVRIEGMPAFSGIPHAAIVDHKGKFVMSGGLQEVLAALPKVIAAAPVPIQGSLLGNLEIKQNKGIERRLVFGQNIEPVLQDMISKAKTDNEAGREAAEIVKACEAALAEKEAIIKTQLENEPSQALDSMAKYAQTCPAKAKMFAADLARLNNNPDIKKLLTLRAEVEKMEAVKTMSKSAARNALQAAALKRAPYAPLCENADAAVQAEAKTLLTAFDKVLKSWDEQAK